MRIGNGKGESHRLGAGFFGMIRKVWYLLETMLKAVSKARMRQK